MLPQKRLFFHLPDIKDQSGLFDAIEKQFTLVRDGSRTINEQFFDSFDWRLFKEKLFLILSNNRFRLTDRDEQCIFETDAAEAKKYLWQDFSSRPFRERLQPILEHRAVCPLVGVRKIRHDYRLTNKDGKIVVNLCLIVYLSMDDTEDQQRAAFLDLKGVRGYESAFRKTEKIIRRHGATQECSGQSVLISVLQASHRRPLDYSSKYSVALESDWRVGQVSSVICLHLLDTMKRNLEFMLTDIDTEFLHDFRVANRRTRTFLSLMKKLLPEQTAHFMAEFKWLGSLTGPVRDFDVYLLMKDHYASLLPRTLRAGLPYFFTDLERRRGVAFEKMVEGLRSDRFSKLMDGWRCYITDFPAMADNGNWNRPCRPEAVKRIHKRFVRILKDGKRIDDDSEDECLHDLRIQAKKFRYALEFFTPYFQHSDVNRFVKHLKKLQNNLGDFNDLSVQQLMLEDYQAGLTGRSKRDLKIAAALGGLITHLAEEQHLVRKNFNRTFKHFTKKENIRLFERTLSVMVL